MANQIKHQSKWTPGLGVIIFVITMLWLVRGSTFITFKLGSWWQIVLELVLLAIAVLHALINKTPLKELFPIKKISVRDFFGSSLMWLGALLLGYISIFAVSIFLPQGLADDVNGLEARVSSSIAALAFIGMVIMPPVCEEALTRGTMLTCFRGIKKDWVIILIIACIFGAMHCDATRFLNTAIFGAVTAYIMLKRENILLGMMIHFFQNFLCVGISLIGGALASPADIEEAGEAVDSMSALDVTAYSTFTLGIFMIIGFLAPVMIAVGAHIIKRQAEIDANVAPKGMKLWIKLIISGVLAASLFIGGIAVLVTASSNGDAGSFITVENNAAVQADIDG